MLRETSGLIGRASELSVLWTRWCAGARCLSIHGMPGMGKRTLARALLERAGAEPGARLIENLEAPDVSCAQGPRLVVTSARRSVCPPGVQLELGPLSFEAALELYEARSGRSGALERPDARALIAALDGWPLAIERAAERVQLHAEGALRSARGGLAEALGLSSLLSKLVADLAPDARTLLRGLARFEGSFELRMARALIDAPAEPALLALRDRGLVLEVRADAQSVMLRLPALLRAHLRARRAPLVAVGWAHALIQEAEQQRTLFYGSAPAVPAAWLRNYLPDLERLSQSPETPPALAARAALAAEPLITTSGSIGACVALLERACAAAEESGDERLLAEARWALAKAWVTRNCFEQSEATLRIVEPLAERIDSVNVAAHIYIALGCSLASKGRTDEARAYLNEAQAWGRDTGNDYLRLLAGVQFSFALTIDGRTDDAALRAEHIEREAQALALPRIVALARAGVGWAHVMGGRPQRAIGPLSLGARTLGVLGETSQMLKLWSWNVRAWRELGAVQRAEALCLEGLKIARRAQDEERELLLRLDLAELYARTARIEEAVQALGAADGLASVGVAPELTERQRAITQMLPEPIEARPATVVIERAGRWIEGCEGRVELGRRGAVRRVLERLVEGLREAPGVPVSSEEVFAAGWPKGAMGDGGAGRVYTAIWTLRKLGLKDALVTCEEGYFLRVEVVRVCAG